MQNYKQTENEIKNGNKNQLILLYDTLLVNGFIINN